MASDTDLPQSTPDPRSPGAADGFAGDAAATDRLSASPRVSAAQYRRRRIAVGGVAAALLSFGVAGVAALGSDGEVTTTAAADASSGAAPTADSSGAGDGAAADGVTSSQVASTAAPTTTLAPATGPVTLIFGGDVHLDGPLASTLANNPDALFDGLQPALSDADVAVLNLETAVTTRGTPMNKAFTFRTTPAIYDAMANAGVDVIAGANNHSIDYGPDGFVDTLNSAKEHNARLIGVGWNEAEAFAPATVDVRGTKVAIINATDVLDAQFVTSWTATPDKPGVASAKQTERLLAEVTAARASHHIVVVFLHWGVEATTCPSSRQETLAAQLREAGADLVIGSHAHRVLAGGMDATSYVHYGLGNLVFKTSSAEGRRTGLARIVMDGRNVTAAQWLPARIGADYTPTLLAGAEAAAELQIVDERRACTNLAAAPVP